MFSFGDATGRSVTCENGQNAPLFCLLLFPLLLGFVPAPLAEEGDGTRKKQIVGRAERSSPRSVPSAKVGDVDDELRLCSCETLDAPAPTAMTAFNLWSGALEAAGADDSSPDLRHPQ